VEIKRRINSNRNKFEEKFDYFEWQRRKGINMDIG
jgi:hypothetical protein